MKDESEIHSSIIFNVEMSKVLPTYQGAQLASLTCSLNFN
jgi:hypothetical protein